MTASGPRKASTTPVKGVWLPSSTTITSNCDGGRDWAFSAARQARRPSGSLNAGTMTENSKTGILPLQSSRHIYIYDPGHFTPYYNAGLCRQFAAMGFDCTLLTSPPTFEAVEGGAYRILYVFFGFLLGPLSAHLRHRPRLRYLLKGLCYPAGVWRTYQTLRRLESGVFHIHAAVVPPLDALLARLLRRRGWRIVYTFQEPHPCSIWNRWSQAQVIKVCDSVLMHGEDLASRLRGIFPEFAGRIAPLPHGMDMPQLASEAERESSRRELGVSSEEQLLLFVGMIKPYKGLEDLLDAMPDVLKRMPDTRLSIAGEPLMPMGEILQKAAALPAGRVILRLRFVPQEKIGRLFAAADLVAAPYRRIQASSIVLQAQSYAPPVLVTRVGALPVHVDEGRCGFLAEGSLADSIVEALASRERLEAAGRRGRERVQANCSWEMVAEATLRFYSFTEEGVAPTR